MLSLSETIEQVPFENLRFGLIPSAACAYTDGALVGAELDLEYWQDIDRWYDHLTIADTQTLSSCESNSFTLIVETMMAYFTERKLQLRYELIYEYVCNEWHGGRDEGSMMGEACVACKRLGVIPATVNSSRLSKSIRAIIRALKDVPVHVGLSIDDGWRGGNLSPHNNCVDHLFPTVRGNGHAVVIVGTVTQDGERLFVIANSWGPKYKLMCISAERLMATLIDFPVQYTFANDLYNWKIPARFITATL